MSVVLRRKTKAVRAPLDGVDVVLADLDGVVYAGAGAIPHAVESLNRAAETVRVGYITNNASRTDATVAGHLNELGLHVAPEEIVTSPQAAVRLLAGTVEPGATILVVGGDGLVREIEKAGYRVTRSAEDSPAAVMQGFAPEVGWTQLAEAAFALQRDDTLPWIATNTDWTIPQARGIAPGNGTLVSAVHTAIGRLAVVAGKPEVPIFEEAKARFGATKPLFIGDRLDTDILGARFRARSDRHRQSEARAGGGQILAADLHPRGSEAVARAVPGDTPVEGWSDGDGAGGDRVDRRKRCGHRRGGRWRDRSAARRVSGDLVVRAGDLRVERAGAVVRLTESRPVVLHSAES
jgi:glycerol 3-phosphatase-2